MKASVYTIGIEKYFNIYKELLANTIKGRGAILAISGEAGMGKTALLNKLYEDCEMRPSVNSVLVDNQAPIGKMDIGKIQPLLPFTKVIEGLINKKEGNAEKKFYMNVGMTVLASIPFAGEVFYAVKELSKDWRQFKKEKSSENLKQASSAAAEFYDSIVSIASKAPLVVFFDDMHWADAQSIELLSLLTENISDIPLLIVMSFRKSIIDSKGTPLYSYLLQNSENSKLINIVELIPFTLIQTKELVANYLPGTKKTDLLDKWLYNRSLGIPAVITEYLKYFQKYPPIDSFGVVDETKLDEKFLPTTLNAVFSQTLELITEEERNLFAVCSAEGREFTAIIVSQLLNLDILTTIKKLRILQQKTGIITSIGAKTKYGVKTTAYEFTQAFYHSYFQNTLEYEEKIALHGQIAALLKIKYEEAASEELKSQIAPYLAAHSSESGDDLTAQNMLLKSAEHAQSQGNTDVVSSVYQSFKELIQTKTDTTKEDSLEITPEAIAFSKIINENLHNLEFAQNRNEESSEKEFIVQKINFNSVRSAVVDDFHDGKLREALEKATTFMRTHSEEISISEKAQLLAIVIRIKTEMKDFHSAQLDADEALRILSLTDDPISECFVLNSLALLKHNQHYTDDAYSILKRTAQKTLTMPAEVKLITLSNIASILETINPKKAIRYFKAVSDLSGQLKCNITRDT